MKFLILLALLASCGKHEMPTAKDLGDSDGDQIRNEYDSDKDIANIVPLNELEADMSFISDTQKISMTLSNKQDLQELTRNYLVRSTQVLKLPDFFTEFTRLKVKVPKAIPEVTDDVIALTLRFPSSLKINGKLVLVAGDQKTDLGDWNEVKTVQLTKDQLNSVLKEEAYFAINNLYEKAKFFIQTQEQTIAEKTNRVIFSDGKSTNIYYISKQLKYHDILKKFNIASYKLVDEENLLTTNKKSETPEWWVRQVNNSDIVIAKEDVRELALHYLKGFTKITKTISRVNGYPQAPLKIVRNKGEKVLIKIKAVSHNVVFSKAEKTEGQRIGGRDHDFWRCTYYSNVASPVTTTMVSRDQLNKSLSFNGFPINLSKDAYEMKTFTDSWEMNFVPSEDTISLNLEALPAEEYVQEGLYASKCVGATEPKVKPNLQVPERSMDIEIEAYVEKI